MSLISRRRQGSGQEDSKRGWAGRVARPLAFLLCSVLVLVGFNAGTSSAATSHRSVQAKHITIAIVFYTKTIPYYQAMLRGMQVEAHKLGDTLSVSYGDFSVTDEVNLMDNAVVKKPNGIIMAPIDRNALVPPTQQAKKAGIPVITVGDQLAPAGQKAEVAYVGQSYQHLGALKAQWLVNKIHGKGQILVVHGIRGLDYVEAQHTGYASVFKKYPHIKVVEGPYGNLSSEVGLQEAENMLTVNPHPTAIWFDNDDLAIGGIQALRERHLSYKSIVTIGSDGADAAVQLVRQHKLWATWSIRPYATGVKSIQVMHDYVVNHKHPKNPTPVQLLRIDWSNVAHITKSDYQ